MRRVLVLLLYWQSAALSSEIETSEVTKTSDLNFVQNDDKFTADEKP